MEDKIEGIENGLGPFKYQNGDRYVGNWFNYQMDGYGVYTYADDSKHKYQGQWKDS
tara:strand:- start:2031 stop:2198 length:168 start_codon:yes stop_codon:yes gene_type:complete